MFHRIQSITPKDSYILTATFLDGTVKDYDLKPLFVEIPVFNDLNTISGLYEQVHVDVGGYGIVWNDSTDLSSDEIWENGGKVSYLPQSNM